MKSEFCKIPINLLSSNEALKVCHEYLNTNDTHTIFFLNAHCFNLARINKKYFQSLRNTSLLLNDGIGIKLALFLSGLKPKENMNGTDFIPKIIELAQQADKKIFILGSKENYAKKCMYEINSRYKKNIVVGFHSGYFSDKEEPEVLQIIRKSNCDILIVGMGVPKQELWISDNLERLCSVRLIIAGGGIIDFIAKKFPRAPKIMRKVGMEWIYRLLHEPKRLFKRYVIGNFLFLVRIIFLTVRRSY